MKKHFPIVVIFSISLFTTSCATAPDLPNIDFRQAMRDFVIDLSEYSKGIEPGFIIIPQNGQELITDNGEGDGTPNAEYIAAIDATGRESMFYGYYNDDEITPDEDKQHLLDLCLLCEAQGIEVLATDYCLDHTKMDNSYQINFDNNFISFAADQRDLNNIPVYPATIYNENTDDITIISQAKNFLYLINSENYATKNDFIIAVNSTNYDVVLMDLYHNEEEYTQTEIAGLKSKANGAARLVIAYMSIAEAEEYRYYWINSWRPWDPVWLEKENPEWEGNYKVRYWDCDWQNIIFGNDNSYLKKILDAGFDGAYLDIIDGFEYFEEEY
ncbi:MAG: endo alpha-1,4 polygalactosaminidase [Spirochaetia bacterium]|jgi:cysteinyl-tRNA synthetase|nr:endo alpha-1,4 polygalactosaminidase [Spirochaetia bacterium]